MSNANNKGKAWAVTMAVYLASIAVAINQAKVPPVMQVLMSDLDAGMVTGGWLMSVVSLTSLVLAIPSALFLMRLGLKVSGLVALSCTVTGAILGSQATTATTLLLGRLIEGGGAGLLFVAAPATISAWFEPSERGLPMGIWATWVPVGNVIIFNLAPPLLQAFGWQGVWWFGALSALLALALYGLAAANPPRREQTPRTPPGDLGRMLASRSGRLLAFAFGTFSFCLAAYNTWAPTFLADTLSLDAAAASSYTSMIFLAAIPANISAGWALGRLKNRYALLPVAFAITGLLYGGGFRLGSASVVVPYMMALGFASNLIPAASFTLAPETMPGLELAALSLALLAVGSNLGSLTGPPVVGSIVSRDSWAAGGACLVIVTAGGVLASYLVSRKLKAT